jgi:trehalose/maltose hydrolase-like predicted phosphorylase
LAKKEWNVLKETADFWVSRVVENQDGSYSILNVVGADEYAQHVDDNAFTNASAIE